MAPSRHTPLPTRLCVALAALLCTLGLACRTEPTPPLVELSELSPREAEVGDRLELRGSGFPQGKPAHVVLRGTVRRPGERPVTEEIELEGTVSATDRVEVVLSESVIERFCGRGEHAGHATFAGEVEVGFRSSLVGAPPLVAVLGGATLDVRPTHVPPAISDARSAEGARVLAFLGVTPGASGPRGIPVDAVQVGSPAAEAGLRPGDTISAVDGVRVFGVDDLLPASARSLSMAVRRADTLAEDVLTIPLVGYATARIPVEYAPALVLVAMALAVLLVLVAPGPLPLGAFEASVTRHLRGVAVRSFLEGLVGRGAYASAAVAASVALGAVALVPQLIGADLDGAALFVIAVALFGAARVSAAKGAAQALGAVFEVVLIAALLAAAFGGTVLHGGAYAIGEIVRAQGGAPWAYAAARDPGGALFALAYGGALVALVWSKSEANGPLLSAPPKIALAPADGPRMLARAGLVIACGLGVALFFGGWQVPGAEGSRATLVQIVGALCFVAKTWLLVAMVLGASLLVPPTLLVHDRAGRVRGDAAALRVFVGTRVLPALALGGAFVAVSRRFAPSRALGAAWGALVVAILVLLVVRAGLRVRSALLRPAPHASPFL